MSADYLHGVETVVLDQGSRPVREPRTAAIVLIGTAPEGPQQTLTLVRNKRDAAQFGDQFPGFTIPQALDAIFKQSNGLVAVINVVDNSHYSMAPNETHTDEQVVIDGEVIANEVNEAVIVQNDATGDFVRLSKRINNVATVVVTNVAGTVTYVVGVDYTIDPSGRLDILNALLIVGTTLHVDYQSFVGGTGQLAFAQIPGNNPVITNQAGTTTYVAGTDYNISATGVITSLTIPDGTVLVDYTSYETVTVENMAFGTDFHPFIGASVQVFSADRSTTYQAGLDYQYDEYNGYRVLLGGNITEGDSLQVRYQRFDASTVNAADIIGSFDSGTQTRTGMFLLEECYNEFGFKPKIILVPGYNLNASVWPEMISRAEQFRAVALFDSESGWTVAEALQGRGAASTSNFNTGSDRVILCYPWVNVQHPFTGETETRPMSPFVAGLISKVDHEKGFWFSPSNNEITGILNLETTVTWDFQSADSEANALNEVGICTLGKPYGSGWRFWGNRSAMFPSDTAMQNFIPVRRVADTLHEAVELAMLPFIDQPILNSVIESIKETVNSYIRTLIQRGALVDGRCFFDPGKNPPSEIALGHLTFDIEFAPPTPAERITFESFIDISLLGNLGA